MLQARPILGFTKPSWLGGPSDTQEKSREQMGCLSLPATWPREVLQLQRGPGGAGPSLGQWPSPSDTTGNACSLHNTLCERPAPPCPDDKFRMGTSLQGPQTVVLSKTPTLSPSSAPTPHKLWPKALAPGQGGSRLGSLLGQAGALDEGRYSHSYRPLVKKPLLSGASWGLGPCRC